MIYTEVNCGWCGKEDMCISLALPNEPNATLLLCIPCINEVYEDWKSEQASITHLTRIK